MKRNLILFLSIILFLACKENRENSDTIKMTLYESYDLGEIYPSIITANNITRKQQLDSIAEKSSGSAILDEMNRFRAKSDTIEGKSLEDYPLFRHLFTSYRIDKNGIARFDSLAIIATTNDTLRLLQDLTKFDTLFPNDFYWKFAGEPFPGIFNLHAIKMDGERIDILESDIDSILVYPIGFGDSSPILRKASDLVDISEFQIELRLKKELDCRISNKTYSLIIDTGKKKYSGSVVNFDKDTGQHFKIGIINYKDYLIFKEKFGSRIKIKKLTVANTRYS